MAKPTWNVTFINRRLSEAEKTHFKGWEAEYADDVYTLLAEALRTGYKMSFTYVDVGDYYIVSTTDKNEKSSDHNCCVTSRHDKLETAVLVALYKHHVVLTNGDWQSSTPELDWG